MSNYDVVITAAAQYHRRTLSQKHQLAMLCYARGIVAQSNVDYVTTNALLRLGVANAVACMGGIPDSEFPKEASPQMIASLMVPLAANGNATQKSLAGASLNSQLSAIAIYLAQDIGTLARLNVFLDGVANGGLT